MFMTGCADREEDGQHRSFFESTRQSKSSRVIKDTTYPKQMFDLIDLNVFNDGGMDVNGDFLYVADIERNKVVKIDRNTWNVADSIGNGEGQGPGEAMDIGDFAVYGKKLYIPDRQQRKIMVFSKSGKLIRKITTESFPPEDVEILRNGNIMASSSPVTGKYVFYVLDDDGKVINKFFRVSQSENILRYEGHVDLSRKKNVLYYSGYTEPVIKSIDPEGKSRFTKEMINSFNTEGNYVKSSIDTENVRYSYSDHAIYASFDVVYRHGNIIVSPINDRDGNLYNFLDFYDSNGNYKHTIYMGREVPFTDITIAEDSTAYTIEQRRDGGGTLFVYDLSSHL